MTFVIVPQIEALVFDASSFFSMHPGLVHEIGGHSIAHVLYSFIKRTCHRRGLSRREMRKVINRRNRWFVDNIIMHHKRLHDHNRKVIISDARKRALTKKENNSQNHFNAEIESKSHANKINTRSHFYDSQNYSESADEKKNRKEQSQLITNRLEMRKKRARSRWIAHFNNQTRTKLDDKDDC
ncbi:hypothetical protein LBMAG18_00370 [Alphaproteobacteria bacterium]|nr:hypothetical protein LBMAG18_00370 [Alphaproteobacteria bacterium]